MRAKTKKRLMAVFVILVAVLLLWIFLQRVYPHFHHPFVPDYPRVDLTNTLSKDNLTADDYGLILEQSGLGKDAVDTLRELGRNGLEQIRTISDAFWNHPGDAPCRSLGITTKEHRFVNENGDIEYKTPLAPLKNGDILVSLSTHTAGWFHGHAGIVVDAENGITLESVVLGSLSCQMDVNHWRSYDTLAVLRPNVDDETRDKIAKFALNNLDNIPYSLISGVFGDKFQPITSAHSAHCGYLPWYACMSANLDIDSDGGRIAAPEDFLHSPNLEVVQVFGMDPSAFVQ